MSQLKETRANLCFRPFSNSWVAIHPEPKGIIQFVGSFLVFGSLPTVFYNSLFRGLYNKKYTIIAYPSFIFPPLSWKLRLVDHWQASLQLLKEEYALKYELIEYILTSIFLAPEIYGTEERNGKPKSAIPFFDLFPDGRKTICLIDKSQNFFGLTALISFRYDKISKDDVKELRAKLSSKSDNFICKIFGGCDLKIDRLSSLFSHLKPLSSNSEPLADCIDKIFDELRQRSIPHYVPQKVQCEACEDCPI